MPAAHGPVAGHSPAAAPPAPCAERPDGRGRAFLSQKGQVPAGDFSVSIHGEHYKFSSAHFVAYKGFRERLHGHNYTMQVNLAGPVGPDGYVIDFGDMKAAAKRVCKELNEYVLLPMRSDVLDISVAGGQVEIRCEDGSRFSLPEGDCLQLPIVHSTAEELAHFVAQRLVGEIGEEKLRSRGLRWLEVHIAERPSQSAMYRRPLEAAAL